MTARAAVTGIVPSGARFGGALGTTAVFPTPRAPARVTAGAVAYPEGLLFDFGAGEVVLDGQGRPVRCDGWTAWAQWCLKAVLTQRRQSIAVGQRYGLDANRVRAQPTRAAQEAVLAAELARALRRDRRTRDVRGFSFAWRDGGVTVRATVTPRVGAPVRLSAQVVPPLSLGAVA